MIEFDNIYQIINRWNRLGEKKFSTGCRLIGHVPQYGIHAYLHRLYAPLNIETVNKLEDRSDRKIPDSYKNFLLTHNGCSLFKGVLEIFGCRENWTRSDIDSMHCQPVDIETSVRLSPEEGIFFTSFEDGTRGLIDYSGNIFRISINKNFQVEKILKEWKDLNEFIYCECVKLDILFDDMGNNLLEWENMLRLDINLN